MNKEEIINIMKKYNFDTDKYVIISSAALVLYGIKDKTKDIDISVTKDYYDFLLNNFNCTFERKNLGNNVYYIDDIINFSTNYYNKNESIILSDLRVQTINDIIKLKEELNRDKDKKDLLAINSAKIFYLHELKLLIYEVVKIININITDRKVIEDILDEIMYISYFYYKEAYQIFDLLINYYSKIDKNRALIYINNMKELNNEKNIIKYLVK